MLADCKTFKPVLKEPFPNPERYWKDPKTGLLIPKHEVDNIEWRSKLLRDAEDDDGLQADLLAASKESIHFWINAFMWTFHQFEVKDGQKVESYAENCPFITWDIQDELFNEFQWCLANGKSILIDKCRDTGASWCSVAFIHWLWLFRPNAKLLEMSRTKDYVDQTGNPKALFQKHDHINLWLPDWMRPPLCLPDERYRTSMHLHNVLLNSTLDGESTTPHAGSGDRRLVLLLDEFAKVEHGSKMRSATTDVALMRIINSTPAGAGTEYARWKQSGQIKVFKIPYWEHPQKGEGRYVKRNETTGEWEVRSPWFDREAAERSPKELAQEVLCQDLESGDTYFSITNFQKHISMFACEPKYRFSISMAKEISDEQVAARIQMRDYSAVRLTRNPNGDLRVWCELLGGRPDQSKAYIIGCDISKGQGASNSVLSVKCRDTGEKIAEWRNALTPPYEMARLAIALAIWCGGRKPSGLPFLKWEMNGPGWDFGRQVVKTYSYPYYYKAKTAGSVTETPTQRYGWHSSSDAKNELLRRYDRAIAHGGYVNHSDFALREAMLYIYLPDGGIGPASLTEENASARKTHGDCVIADALTIDDDEVPKELRSKSNVPANSVGHRMQQHIAKRKAERNARPAWRTKFNFLR